MKKFYKRFYDDAVFETIGETEKYNELREKRKNAENDLLKLIGGVETKEWEAIEKLLTIHHDYVNLVALEMYLKGAEDRDKMLE